jgi:hypothetical protein
MMALVALYEEEESPKLSCLLCLAMGCPALMLRYKKEALTTEHDGTHLQSLLLQ